ncbi:MAG: PAS domain S-box protein [Marinilabiliaceae bacterium]|nr:PAS domain S-box protein [Marinilabiliaceae bacterium]
MKNKKLNRQIWSYALKGFFFGMLIALIATLLAADSTAYHQSRHTLSDFVDLFPSIWVIVLFPVLCGAATYFVAWQLSKIIYKQKISIKQEEKRGTVILKFVEDLGEGKFDATLQIEDENDKLGNALTKLHDYLISNKKEEEQRRLDEQQRTWVTNGLAQFAEILRRNNDNMEELSYNIIRYLVDYMKINQAGFFLLNSTEEEAGEVRKYFELIGFVAYNRKKYTEKIIPWGEGLVGRCGLEQETIYMTDIPDNYMTVTSGLGESNPRSLLLVPLKSNDEVFGVIEMASFQPFLEYEIQFVEKTAESIAMTIANVRNNIKTSNLLRETQNQAEAMVQKEEQLNQNIEELQATQEENERRQIEMNGIIAAVNKASLSCEFEVDGTIIKINENFLKTFKYRPEEIEGQNIKVFIFKEDVEKFEEMLEVVRKGETYSGRVRRRTKKGEEVWLLSTYSPVINAEGKVFKILSLENDIVDQVKLEEEMKRSKEELEIMIQDARREMKEQFKEIEAVKIRNEMTLEGALDAIITINKEGVIEFFNAAAEKLWGYDRQEVLQQNVKMLFSDDSIQNDEFIKDFVTPELTKIVGERREVPIKNKFGEEVPVLFLLSEAEVGDEHSFTAFIQNVEVELF